MKYRDAETRVSRTLNFTFSENIIPLFEIIHDFYEKRYKIDPETNDFVYKEKNGRKYRVVDTPTKDDIVTLNKISDAIGDKKAFVDFLRIDDNKYKSYDASKVKLGIELRSFNEYKKRLLEITKYGNLIPVISIRNAFENNTYDINELYKELKKSSSSVAVRITADVVGDYMSLLEKLQVSDYLLFDIEETNVLGLSDEIDEINAKQIFAKKIILNSPRKAEYQNKDFEESGITELIDNSMLKKYKELGFSGFGDYAGYKDVLPSSGGNNRGSALCLLYNYKENGFWVFTNKDTTLGSKGYKSLKPKVLAIRPSLDPDNACLAYKKIELLDCGNYPSWIEVCLIRYITQLYNHITDWN